MLFLITYVSVFIKLTNLLEIHYPAFYNKEKFKIIGISLVVVTSLFSRFLLSLLYSTTSLFEHLSNVDIMIKWYFPVLLFLETFIITLLPMFSLIYSLMDSINQKKEIMRMQLRASVSHSRTTVGGGARDYGTVLSDFTDDEIKGNNNRVRNVKSFLYEQEQDNSASFRGSAFQ